jgi:hypothetical protein
MRTLNIVVYAVALVLAVAAYLRGENRHILGITEAIKTLLPVLPTLIGAYLIAGYVRVLLPESVIREWLGEESGFKGGISWVFSRDPYLRRPLHQFSHRSIALPCGREC